MDLCGYGFGLTTPTSDRCSLQWIIASSSNHSYVRVSHLEHCETLKLGKHLLAFGQLLCVERQLSTVQLLLEYILAAFIVDEVRNILFMFIGLTIGIHRRDCDDLRE